MRLRPHRRHLCPDGLGLKRLPNGVRRSTASAYDGGAASLSRDLAGRSQFPKDRGGGACGDQVRRSSTRGAVSQIGADPVKMARLRVLLALGSKRVPDVSVAERALNVEDKCRLSLEHLFDIIVRIGSDNGAEGIY